MSVGLYSHTTRATGTVLTAAIYNSDHTNHITNQNPTMTGALSDNLTQHQLMTDPGGVGTEVLASNLADELTQIRYCLDRIIGKTHWYEAPSTNLESVGGTITDLVALESVAFRGDLTPAQITTNQNNYAPTSHADAFIFRLSSDASRNITGLAGGADGRIVAISNVGSFNIVLTNDDALSTAANRFLMGAAATILPGLGLLLIYDPVSSRWRPLVNTLLDTYTLQTLNLTNLLKSGYIQFPEISAPANPAANFLRLYGIDVAGTSKLAYRDSAGVQTIVETPTVLAPRSTTATYTSNANLSADIPDDDTIPQNTEGSEIVAASITPQSTSSKILIIFTGQVSMDAASGGSPKGAIALFKDSDASALNAEQLLAVTSIQQLDASLTLLHSPSTTSSVTYKIRAGRSGGTSGIGIRFNGSTTGRKFGGASAAVLTLIEVLPGT